MSTEIVVAIIGALAILIASIITAIVQTVDNRRNKIRLAKIEAVTIQSSTSLKEEFTESCGYKTNAVYMKMRMIDLQGKTEIVTSHQGFQVHRKDLTIAHIPGGVWVQHPDGYIETLPYLTSPPSLLTKAVELRDVNVKEDGKRCTFKVEVTGGLTSADPPFDFEDRTVLSKGVCITKEEMEEIYKSDDFKKEYHSYDVIFPMDVLVLEVEFPEGYSIQPYPIVFYLYSELVNNIELTRVKTGFQSLVRGARFTVDEPRVGFRYAIYWIPPTIREVERLLQ